MSSDEEDYMSDKLLQHADKVRRPGLIWSQTKKRELATQEIIKKNKIKPMAVLQSEKREEGLQTALSSDNKGYKLLQKMGYKPGQSLGKKENGLTEPIPIQVKSNRSGLGKDTELEENRKKKDEELLNHLKISAKNREELQKEFLINARNKAVSKQEKVDLHKSQRVCEILDKQKDQIKPVEKWFWLEMKTESESDDTDEEEDNLSVSEKLEILTKYLRSKHFYCLWCGTSYDDEKDLSQECPGNTSDCH